VGEAVSPFNVSPYLGTLPEISFRAEHYHFVSHSGRFQTTSNPNCNHDFVLYTKLLILDKKKQELITKYLNKGYPQKVAKKG